jgi:hypothetical protein
MSEEEMAPLKAAHADLQAKISHADDASAHSKQATADKHESRLRAEEQIRWTVKRVKSHAAYTEGIGANLGIVGHEKSFDLKTSSPDLSGTDQSDGNVTLSFSKYKSDGITLYSKREGDADWIKLDRITHSPFHDNRPLLTVGKPELRRYIAVYMSKNDEIGKYSDEVVLSCAP